MIMGTEPRDEQANVAPVLTKRVGRTAIGLELEEEPIEGGLDVHAWRWAWRWF